MLFLVVVLAIPLEMSEYRNYIIWCFCLSFMPTGNQGLINILVHNKLPNSMVNILPENNVSINTFSNVFIFLTTPLIYSQGFNVWL